jgi:hypothetical protein
MISLIVFALATQASVSPTPLPLKAAYESCVRAKARKLARANADAGDTADAALAACRPQRDAWFNDMLESRPYGSAVRFARALDEAVKTVDEEFRRAALLEIIEQRAK